MNKVILKIGGMSCSACSNGLEKYLNRQENIISASVNLVLAQALIEYNDKITLEDINKYIKEAGFESLGIYNEKDNNKESSKDKKQLIIFSILTIIIMYIAMAHMLKLPIISFLDMTNYPTIYVISLFMLTIPFLFYGSDIFKSGYKNLKHRMPNMDTLVTISVFASLIYSIYGMVLIVLKGSYIEMLYFESVSMVIYFIKLGRYISSKSKEKTTEAIKQLVQITPSKALLKIGNKEKEVTIDEVKKDDILIAKPGMKIAVDGIIVKGNTHLDEMFITGESKFNKRAVGDEVIAGSINYDGYIEYQAKRIGKDSTISNIVKLVIESSNTKSPIAKTVDKVSSYFVPIIIVISIITLISYLIIGFNFKETINAFVTILVVACPCALGLATPLAIVVAEGICAKNGIIVKTSEILENAHKVDKIVFDKTGTLTYGNIKISKIFNYSNYKEKELLEIVSSIESKSTHPISRAFSDYKNSFEVTDHKIIEGIGLESKIDNDKYYLGNNKLFKKLKIENNYLNDEKIISGNGSSIIYVIKNNEVLALIGVNDIVRENAKKTVLELKKLGKDIIMLTGDNENAARGVANILGIDNVISSVTPKDKMTVIKDMIKDNKKVMMVGDGINDAISLVSSSVGVSIGSGTDIAMDSSDVILMSNNLENIVTLIKISKDTLRNIKQNLFWAFFYNICMIPIAMGLLKPFGIVINPMIASITMTISSLTVVFNALRLRSRKD